MTFKAVDYLIKIKGNDYMPVPARVQWFRDEHPNGGIHTDVSMFGDVLIVRASVSNGDSAIIATGLATVRSGQGQNWSGREIEKAETAAVGRALGFAGYGTQFAGDEFDDSDYISDSPQSHKNASNSGASTQTGTNPQKTEKPSANGDKPAMPKSDVRRDWTLIYSITKDLAHFNGQTKHVKNAIDKLISDGELDPLADDMVWIKAVINHYATGDEVETLIAKLTEST